ncbi:MAG: hypothetical protein WBB23_09605 [Desulforhopalus sp.]
MAASMRRGAFNFSPRQIKILRDKCKSLNIPYESLSIHSGTNLDFRWARINVLLDSIVEWQHDDVGRLRRFVEENQQELRKLFAIRDEINKEFYELKVEKNENRAKAKIESFLDKSLAELFRNTALFVAKASCIAELSESGRSSRISQLGFEGGMSGLDRISARQILNTIFAILCIFLLVSVVEQLFKAPQFRRFDNVLFITFLMMFTYGSALIIALCLRRNVGMGYNELTRQRSWFSYLLIGLITALSWFVITGSYRYIINMLSGIESEVNVNVVLTDLGWSFPYALQSLALAVSISWILDFHQSRGISEKLEVKQRIFDVAVSMTALGIMSITAFCWMEGKGWFEGFATRDTQFQNKTSFVWFVTKGIAVSAVVGWLVPMWFHMNRTKAPDQIAGRLIKMNKKGLSKEIRNLEPNQLVKTVAAVSASVAATGNNISRNEADVYQIICGQLSGLPNSDVDIDTAKIEFERCLKMAKNDELELEKEINSLGHLRLITSLLPYVATAVAFADGVYLDEERRIIERIEKIVHPES